MSSLNISSQAHIASQSVILGDVTIGADSSVFYYAVVRGDEASITIGRRSNIQDNSTVFRPLSVMMSLLVTTV